MLSTPSDGFLYQCLDCFSAPEVETMDISKAGGQYEKLPAYHRVWESNDIHKLSRKHKHDYRWTKKKETEYLLAGSSEAAGFV